MTTETEMKNYSACQTESRGDRVVRLRGEIRELVRVLVNRRPISIEIARTSLDILRLNSGGLVVYSDGGYDAKRIEGCHKPKTAFFEICLEPEKLKIAQEGLVWQKYVDRDKAGGDRYVKARYQEQKREEITEWVNKLMGYNERFLAYVQNTRDVLKQESDRLVTEL